jgi:hypothetical protein
MKSCVFVNEEFPTEILKLAKKQLTLLKLKIAIFYTRCWHFVFFYSDFSFSYFFSSVNSVSLFFQVLEILTNFKFQQTIFHNIKFTRC